ncbi:MAG TPA: phosphatidylglycerol lysyltransferase domain-containing protein [Nitrospira sp.]|nr:phosphatidylglycerol lysyltransferase domain-containing protein [Nitrospira sp.]
MSRKSRDKSMTTLVMPTAGIRPEAQPFPQIVPSAACLRCDVCCRFPDPDSPLRPYFMPEEIDRAMTHGLERQWFPSPRGCQVLLSPDEHMPGYHCPAFDSGTGRCRIYEERPLDCRLYPLALMWNDRHDQVVLGWDTKCPFMGDQLPAAIQQHCNRVMELIVRPDVVEAIVRHPRLIGRFQPDVVILRNLAHVTHALSRRWGDRPVHRFELDNLPRLSDALGRSGQVHPRSLSAYSPPYHYMCSTLLAYWWTELDGVLYLFAESPDGWFMPLAPLTDAVSEDVVARGFSLLRERNGRSAVSRMENVPASLASKARTWGYRATPQGGEYLYQADELARLAGNRFKSQRALCNRVERLTGVVVAPYDERDREACRRLMQVWRRQKQDGGLDAYGRWLLEDAVSFHEVVFSHPERLGLGGTVVKIDGVVRGYTFGYWLTDKTWCVLLEVADRTVSGLAQYLFRETCRAAVSRGAEFINTMDDAGLAALRRSKEVYHPIERIENYILSEVPTS